MKDSEPKQISNQTVPQLFGDERSGVKAPVIPTSKLDSTPIHSSKPQSKGSAVEAISEKDNIKVSIIPPNRDSVAKKEPKQDIIRERVSQVIVLSDSEDEITSFKKQLKQELKASISGSAQKQKPIRDEPSIRSKQWTKNELSKAVKEEPTVKKELKIKKESNDTPRSSQPLPLLKQESSVMPTATVDLDLDRKRQREKMLDDAIEVEERLASMKRKRLQLRAEIDEDERRSKIGRI